MFEATGSSPAQKSCYREQEAPNHEAAAGHGIVHARSTDGAKNCDDAHNQQRDADNVQGLKLFVFSNSAIHFILLLSNVSGMFSFAVEFDSFNDSVVRKPTSLAGIFTGFINALGEERILTRFFDDAYKLELVGLCFNSN